MSTPITVIGLRDAQHSGSTAHLIRRIQALGATAEVAKTGRVAVTTKDGERRVYVLEMDPRHLEFSEADYRAADSPLNRALRDLINASGSKP